jgi:hypothetical protein
MEFCRAIRVSFFKSGEILMMRKITVLVSILALTGCGTTEKDLAHEAPTIALVTSAPMTEIRDCLTKPGFIAAVATPIGEGWSVSARYGSFNQNSAWIVNLTPTTQGTKVEGHMALDGVWARDVQPCLDKLPRN